NLCTFGMISWRRSWRTRKHEHVWDDKLEEEVENRKKKRDTHARRKWKFAWPEGNMIEGLTINPIIGD
ncbi:hypothetical protein KI387_025583, partial [Taxus chinensis]